MDFCVARRAEGEPVASDVEVRPSALAVVDMQGFALRLVGNRQLAKGVGFEVLSS